ncbi:hypothetical protein D3C78_1745380 [compost metagenome]
MPKRVLLMRGNEVNIIMSLELEELLMAKQRPMRSNRPDGIMLLDVFLIDLKML